MFRLLFFSHHQAEPKNKKEVNNTVTVLTGDLGIYNVLCKIYNMYIRKIKIVEVKMYNYKTLYILDSCSCILITLVLKS
jgi:hypothetical protein